MTKQVVVELFHDLICPFSNKMFTTVHDGVLPAYGDKVCFVLHQVVQPWHPQGTYVHEVALAVKHHQPTAYVAAVRALVAAHESGKFKDADTWNKTRAQIYEELLDVVTPCGVDRATIASSLVDTGSGTPMTQHLKWAVKFHRVRGVHVTPTVFVNGLEAGVVSSGWTAEQWKAFLEPMGADNFTGTKL